MKTIWKFPLTVTDVQIVMMPPGAEILSVEIQGGIICLWALIDVKKETQLEVPHQIEIVGTGNPMQQIDHWLSRKFIGTVQQGQFVWHIFEIV